MTELNRTAEEGLSIIYREEFTIPETSRKTDKSTQSFGKRQVSKISPSNHLETEMAGSKRSNSIEDGIVWNAGQNAQMGTELQSSLQRL